MFFANYDLNWRQEKDQMEIDLYIDAIKDYEKEMGVKISMDDALSR